MTRERKFFGGIPFSATKTAEQNPRRGDLKVTEGSLPRHFPLPHILLRRCFTALPTLLAPHWQCALAFSRGVVALGHHALGHRLVDLACPFAAGMRTRPRTSDAGGTRRNTDQRKRANGAEPPWNPAHSPQQNLTLPRDGTPA